MPHLLTVPPNYILRLLNWFIPEKLRGEAETMRRVRMFMVSHLFGPFLGHTINLYLVAQVPSPDGTWWVSFGTVTSRLCPYHGIERLGPDPEGWF